MSVAKRIWQVIAMVAIAAGFALVNPISAGDRDEQNGQQRTAKSKAKGKAQDEDRDEQNGQQRTAKSKSKASDVVEIDLSKLPPDLAKEIRDRLKKKSGSKESREGAKKKSKKSGSTISLTDAIKIVEATGKGEVERAGRRLSKGETQFYVEINTGERHRTRITLNAKGKILSSKKAD